MGCMNSEVLKCADLTDSDFPLDYSQKFQAIIVSNSQMTKLPANAFGKASAKAFEISDNPELEVIEANFFGTDSTNVKEISLINNNKLSTFPWNNLVALVSLKRFKLISSAVSSLREYIMWPASLEEIDLTDNLNLAEIPSFAFQKAKGLTILNIKSCNPDLTLRSNAFFTTSPNKPTLTFYSSAELFEDGMTFEEDVFGFLQGGKSWGHLNARFPDFPEDSFRLMLKDIYDQGQQTELLSSNNGPSKVQDCGCNIAWLYKDAHRFDLGAYSNLIGANNVICEGVGPVLETTDEDFIQKMDSCPRAPIEQSHCETEGTMWQYTLLVLVAVVLGTRGECVVQNGTSSNSEDLVCSNLKDGDLPLSGFDGNYGSIQIIASSLSSIPAGCFGGAKASEIIIRNNLELASIEGSFLGSQANVVKIIDISQSPKLTSFDWTSIGTMTGLITFTLTETGISALESDIPWQSRVSQIDLSKNQGIMEIPANAFKTAVNLVSLHLMDMNAKIVLRSKGLHIRSENFPQLVFNSLPGGQGEIEFDAFGDVSGGQLWGTLEGNFVDFPEGAFRLMLKSHFDRYSEEFIIPLNDKTQVQDCSNCSIAWLWRDAFRFGRDEYLRLVGDKNVICSETGPVLESADEDFNAEMQSCPVTEMPGPDENPCEGHGSSGALADTEPDSEDCHCFYHCNSLDEVSGHDCCQPGLGFNPDIPGCDWEANVPQCNTREYQELNESNVKRYFHV
eukprot:maker-scaffold95_size379157-snap-gene-0.24 protein:Tk00591 transcript:maker-scaffold95_size379157-snap-gene-0.24-mRNA-1 annotation:"hypothetical protein ASPNIDRAFT_182707"